MFEQIFFYIIFFSFLNVFRILILFDRKSLQI